MTLEVNLHDLTKVEAIKKLQKEIVNHQDCGEIIAIHGYNNGCVIRDTLMNKINIHSKRVLYTFKDALNKGRTHIVLKRSI